MITAKLLNCACDTKVFWKGSLRGRTLFSKRVFPSSTAICLYSRLFRLVELISPFFILYSIAIQSQTAYFL